MSRKRNVSRRTVVAACVQRLRRVCPESMTPEQQLWFAVIERSILDAAQLGYLLSDRDERTAREYLQYRMDGACYACGIEPDYARGLLANLFDWWDTDSVVG